MFVTNSTISNGDTFAAVDFSQAVKFETVKLASVVWPHNKLDRNREKVQSFTLDAELRAEAKRLSRHFVSVLTAKNRSKIQRFKDHGLLDSTRFPALIRDLNAGRYSPGTTRPFKQRQAVPGKRPHVAIVAAADAKTRNNDSTYCERIARLSLGLSWACEAVGVDLTTSMIRGGNGSRRKSVDAIACNVIEPGRRPRQTDFAAALDDDLFRKAINYTYAHCKGHQKLIHGATRPDQYQDDFGSKDGGNAVMWARETLGADIVIAAGNVLDGGQADARIAADTELEKAVIETATQLSNVLNQKRRAA